MNIFFKENIKEIIKDQIETVNKLMKTENIINRDLDASKYINANTALFILGVRRCGKSTLAAKLFKGTTFGYINFDDERLIGVKVNDLNTILQAFYEVFGTDLEIIIFDEIQNIDGWEKFVSRLRITKKIIVTGSNSKMLSKELSTSMTGRHIDIILYPFSFNEFLRYKGINFSNILTTTERAKINNLIDIYMQNGGFPESLKYGKAILSSIYNDIITKDIVLRYKIKHVNDFKNIASFLISNSSQEYTYSSLRNITNVKNQITVTNWVRYLEESYLLFSLNRFSFKLKNMIKSPRKVYAIDPGIVNLLGFRSDENRSRLMETIVAIELKKRSENTAGSFELYYWKDYQQREVDFIIKKGRNIKQLIQVTYASGKDEIQKREIENLLIASNELKCSNLLIITKDYDSTKKFNNKTIVFVSIWRWLLTNMDRPD